MTTSPLPYFFDEAQTASIAKHPSDREKALNLSMDDLNWLQTVYLPTQAARKNHRKPMLVHSLLLPLTGATDIPLAGAFAMSRPDDGEVMLYTPWKGLIKFADMAAVKNRLKEWLNQDTGKRELLLFLSIEQRAALSDVATTDVSTQEIVGAVFQDQKRILECNQEQNIMAMMAELLKMPTLQSMLDDALKITLRKPFPTLDQRLTRLNSFVHTTTGIPEDANQHVTSSLSLSDALLHYYVHNLWPAGDSRAFSNPGHAVTRDADNQAWESAVKEIAQSFTPYLQSLLETFWNTTMSHGQSRSAFFAEGSRDTFHTRLLLKRQDGVLTTQEYLQLMSASRSMAANDSIHVEKVRVAAPFNHSVELASTLMIGSSTTLGFLYTQHRGIEATKDLAAVRATVLDMMKSEGHEDALFNFMSLDERGTFVSTPVDERVIVGQRILGSVFEQLMVDILCKQAQNLSHALRRYRESEGTQDPHALLDNALDVRGMIDNRLLDLDAAGRWSTHVDQRWIAQPVTVRAESAKAQLARLTSVEQTLEQLLERHPVIPATTRTVAEVQTYVDSSLRQLQASFTHTLATALRSELALHAVTRTLGATEQAIIKAVLDTPVRLQRAALNGFLPDVFALALKAAGTAQPLKLASCFALTERGGLDPVNSGKAILWTPASGFEAFKALTPLLNELAQRLEDEDQRTALLENLGRSERLPGRTYTLAPLQRVDGNFLDQVQKPYVRLDYTCLTHALATQLSPAPLANLLKRVALRVPQTGLRRAMDIAECLTLQQKLPAWLNTASVEDQVLHCELLQQYLDNVTNDQDYLTDIPALERTAHKELTALLKADAYEIDPDNVQVQISQRPGTAASNKTLTEFALTHFKDLDTLRFKLVPLIPTLIPKALDESYIKELIRKINLGECQQKIIKEALAGTQASAEERRKRFYNQLPWQLMHYAHGEKLQERLTPSGFDLIQQIMDMPDAVARAAVEGAHAMIRPLEFTGSIATQSIKVPGVYLIGSASEGTPHQVLVAPYSPRHGLKEYEDESQLLAELTAGGELFDWVLMNLPQSDQALLKQWMASTGKRVASAAPTFNDSGKKTRTEATRVKLASSPIRGNLFKQLFNDNADLLTRLLGCQSDNTKQSGWAVIKHVLGEDLHEAFTFMTGKLSYPITVWNSFKDLKQSAEDLQTHKWKPAIEAFISGVAQLASLRRSMDVKATSSSTPGIPATHAAGARYSWKNVDVTAPERTQLNLYKRSDVDLDSLTHDLKLGLYTDSSTKKQYGPVEGKVFAVEKRGSRWRITGSKNPGLYVRRNVSREWTLDREKITTPHLSILSRLDTAFSVWDGMNVDARGMARIRQFFPRRARAIEQALELATTYAWNSFRNLQVLKKSGDTITPVHQLIMDFFDVPAVLPDHIQTLEKVLTDVFAALLDPTLQTPNSKRFVIGRLLQDAANTFAFTIPTDEKKNIYLAEKFFHPKFSHYRPHLTDSAFPIKTHARAATLIHETAHIACDAVDIAYLDSSRPFVDLIGTASETAIDLKTALAKLQETALSNKTPYTQLFMMRDPDTGAWEDFGNTFEEDTQSTKKHILALTGADNLAGARTIFKKKPLVRMAVQLSNADSVTWLITHLGRQLHTDLP